jgi:hypothetical protein
MLLAMVAPSFTLKVSVSVPPVRFWMLVKGLASLTSPELVSSRFQLLTVLAPTKVLLPPPPSILATLPSVPRVNVSLSLPPVTFSKLEKLKPLASPELVPVMFQLLAVLVAIMVSLSVALPMPFSTLTKFSKVRVTALVLAE